MSAPDVQYQIFDGRFRQDPERAVCLYVADGLKDAIRERPECGDDAVIVDGGRNYGKTARECYLHQWRELCGAAEWAWWLTVRQTEGPK